VTFSQQYFNWAEKEMPGIASNIAAISRDSILIFTDEFKYYASIDAGDTWQEITGELATFNSISSFNVIGKRIFISAQIFQFEAILIYTDNLGQTIDTAITSTNKLFSQIDRYAGGLIASNSEIDQLFASTDSGKTWSYLTPIPPNYEKFAVTNSGNMYYLSNHEIYCMKNFSGSWSLINTPFLINDFGVNEDTIAVVSDANLSYSTDEGNSWVTSDTLGFYGSIKSDSSGELLVGVVTPFLEVEGVLRLTFSPFNLTQICAKNYDGNAPVIFNDGVIYTKNNILFTSEDEFNPVFQKTYYPLVMGNSWLYTHHSADMSVLTSDYYYGVASIIKDTVINGYEFYSFSENPNATFEHFNQSENRVYSYNRSDGIREGISFNYKDYYLQALDYGGDNNMKYLLPMHDIEGTGYHNGLKIKVLEEEVPFAEGRTSSSYLENFGILSRYTSDIFGYSHSQVLWQAKIYSSENDFIIYDRVENPEIIFSFPASTSDLALKFNTKVNHHLNGKSSNNEVNFIEKAFIEYYYYNSTSSSEINSLDLLYDSLDSKTSFYHLDIQLDTTRMGGSDKIFKYRIKATTEGIYPHSDSTDWYELIYLPSSLDRNELSLDYSLSANYPNPFNPSTSMEFTLPKTSLVEISVYNVTGEKLFTVANESYSSGRHQCTINMADYSTGVYFVHMISNEKRFVRKILLLK